MPGYGVTDVARAITPIVRRSDLATRWNNGATSDGIVACLVSPNFLSPVCPSP